MRGCDKSRKKAKIEAVITRLEEIKNRVPAKFCTARLDVEASKLLECFYLARIKDGLDYFVVKDYSKLQGFCSIAVLAALKEVLNRV